MLTRPKAIQRTMMKVEPWMPGRFRANADGETPRKLQAPNTKLQRSSKHQAPTGRSWSLVLGASLELGGWWLEFFIGLRSEPDLCGLGPPATQSFRRVLGCGR